MSTNPLPRQADRVKYPGMRPREGQVFRLWLQQHESEYDRYDYNVRVGAGVDPGPQFPAEVRAMAIANTQRRLDAVAWRAGVPTLIEVKDFAIQDAITQLLAYSAVWTASMPSGAVHQLLIICSNSQPGFLMYAQAAGIRVDVLPPH